MFRVLSLDGGGIRGAFSAGILAEIEERTGSPLNEQFDLIVGTSTGGILALGTALGLPARQMEALYRDRALDIFPAGSRNFEGWFEWWFQPKYSTAGLRSALADTFGGTLFGDIKHRVAITAFDTGAGRPVVFRSRLLEPTTRAHAKSVVEIALATSAAPTYFQAARVGERLLLDGGIWANCPILVGIAEAIGRCERRPDTVGVLSIGTTTEPFSVNENTADGGKLEWASTAVTMFMRASKLGALTLAEHYCGRIVRVDEYVEPGRFSLDDTDGVHELIELGRQSAEHQWNRIASFLDEKPERGGTNEY